MSFHARIDRASDRRIMRSLDDCDLEDQTARRLCSIDVSIRSDTCRRFSTTEIVSVRRRNTSERRSDRTQNRMGPRK